MKKLIAATAALAAFACSTPASAVLVNFDDFTLSTGEQRGLTTYGGLDWFNAFAYDNTVSSMTLRNKQASMPNAIFNGGGGNVGFSSATAFTFNSAAFATTAGAEVVTIRGFSDAAASTPALFTMNVSLTGTPTLFNFNWAGVRSVRAFTNGNIFVLDNITYNAQATAPVPEPATWAMMMLGFGAMGAVVRRRAKVTARVRYA